MVSDRAYVMVSDFTVAVYSLKKSSSQVLIPLLSALSTSLRSGHGWREGDFRGYLVGNFTSEFT